MALRTILIDRCFELFIPRASVFWNHGQSLQFTVHCVQKNVAFFALVSTDSISNFHGALKGARTRRDGVTSHTVPVGMNQRPWMHGTLGHRNLCAEVVWFILER